MLTGAACIDELKSIKSEVNHVFQTEVFELSKWFSNSPEVTASEGTVKPITISDSDSTKALGISWTPSEDALKFKIDTFVMVLRATKRNILSLTSKLFDPFGLLSSIVIRGKIPLQELWLNKLDWDESIPQQLETEWNKLKETLSRMEEISIPRYVFNNPMSPIQLHGFADASMRAYGACVYIRSNTVEGYKVSLLTSKFKTKTLPRLKLCAAHLLADLCHRIKPLLKINIERIVYWSDSEITLHWIRSHPSSFDDVAEIQEWSKEATWRQIPTKQNTADVASRDCDIDDLKESIWFGGPSLELEKRKTAVGLAAAVVKSDLVDVIEGFSSHLKLLRVFVYMFRFIVKCKIGMPNLKRFRHQRIKEPFLKLSKLFNVTNCMMKLKECARDPILALVFSVKSIYLRR